MGGDRTERETADRQDARRGGANRQNAHREDAHREEVHRQDANRQDANRDAHKQDARREDANREDAHRVQSGPPDGGGAAPAHAGLDLVPLEAVPDRDVLELLALCLGPAAVERSAAFWRWKHRDGPFGPSPGLVAVAEGRPVAVRTFLRWRWRSGDRTFGAVRAVDTATHPDWRRRGLFRRLTTALLERVEGEGAAFVFNTPNPTSRAGYLALGWRDVGRVPVMVRPRRPGRLLAALLGGAPGDPATPASGEGPGDAGEREAGAGNTGPDGAPLELADLPSVAELLEDPALPPFLDAWARHEPRLHTPRTVDYLRWRYAAAPGVEYRAAWHLETPASGAAPPGGAVALVRPRRRHRLAEAALVELLVSPDRAGRRAARQVVGRIAAVPGPDYLVAAASPGTTERRVLLGLGFLPLAPGPRWTVRPLATAPAGLHRQRSWRVSAGDLELF